ncbi:transketolase [Psittacicella gerlachiana]|uniref:Transketolase n=1 Tax=Psittacicella gerlachiana TaxID=2028574 RepID=A0A3A1YAH4_9GAMM|nr:transketolase [Psittacicella gerlachiana]RIY35142.1 transketolase [Psittacicella gerlachiana]
MTTPTLRQLCANAIRVLSMDAIQKANSGHPGAPMGMADIAEVLWRRNLKHNPLNPKWANRDRFVLSNGHGSMLIYSLLHLTGYELSLSEIKNFRQLGSLTPGHPEYGHTPGVETTTGPLGQGIANAVGMALAEKLLAKEFNQEDLKPVDHYTYAFLGDGCLMEGVSHEACSLAGTLGLNKLIAFYDSNKISIDGDTDGWFTDNTAERFRAYGWNVIENVDGHNPEQIQTALDAARAEQAKPTLIICKTVIGKGAPNKEGTHHVHGAPLGADEIKATKEAMQWPSLEPFYVPEEAYNAWNARTTGQKLEEEWNQLFANYKAKYPELGAKLEARFNGELEAGLEELADKYIAQLQAEPKSLATRASSQNALNAYAPYISSIVGGSADLAPSNLTMFKGCKSITPEDVSGNYVHYGVREFGMAAIMNGLALHGNHLPYGGTFLMFSSYALNAIRMAALMKLQTVYVFTHDSIGVGEDGPTHQPIENTEQLRLVPNLSVWRPADQVETAVAWKQALLANRTKPTALILTRQNLEQQERTAQQVSDIAKGGYVLVDAANGEPEVIFVATGSEVDLAVKVAAKLTAEGKAVRVVSLPSVDTFEAQDQEYREAVLPSSVRKRVVLEVGSTSGWYKYAGLDGLVLGIDRYGDSAPAAQLFDLFGFTVDKVYDKVSAYLNK